MESRWNKLGSFPLVSYINDKGNELKLRFYEGTGKMLVIFSNPSEELVRICNAHCEKEMAPNGKDIAAIYHYDKYDFINDAPEVKFVIDAVLAVYPFDDKTKKEIQDSVNSFFASNSTYQRRNNRIGMFEPIPMSREEEAKFRKAQKVSRKYGFGL